MKYGALHLEPGRRSVSETSGEGYSHCIYSTYISHEFHESSVNEGCECGLEVVKCSMNPVCDASMVFYHRDYVWGLFMVV